jgi:hypothetical protein
MKKRFPALILTLAMVLAVAVSAAAADVPDMSKTGTINIIMHMGETLVPGGSLTIYRVGQIHESNGDYSFVPVAPYTNCVSAFDDVQSPELALQLAAYTIDNQLTGTTEPVNEDGLATFSNVELGLYLVIQTEPAEGYTQARPFLIGVPQVKLGMYIYDVDASPKVELQKLPEPTTEPTEEPPVASGGKLPQTGQLAWPIPVLAVLGMACIAIGITLRKKSSDV